MSRELLEIVELPDGKIILRRSDKENPIVTLSFSREARAFLKGRYIEVAKSMFHAGLQTASLLQEDEELELEEQEQSAPSGYTLH